MDMIDQIGGWKSVSSIGNNYGQGYLIQKVKSWFAKIEFTIATTQTFKIKDSKDRKLFG